jgi:cell division protein ZipA
MAIAAGQPDQSTRQEPQLTDQDLAVMQTKVESAQAVDQASQSGSRLLQKVTPRCHRVVKQPETSQQSADNQVTHLLKPENDTGQSALAAKDKQSDWPQLLVTNEADKPLMQQEIAKDQLIIVNIQARQEAGFTGPELLQALLSCGLRFGEMDIFHRYQRAQSQEQIQFSLASGVKPGSFNLDDMGSFSTPLLSLFLKLPGPDQPLAAFDSMLEVADKLVNTLTGDLQNKDRQTLSLQQIANYRELIQLWVKQHQQTASLCVDAA